MGEFLIRITAMFAVACYGLRIAIDLAVLGDDRWQRRARWCWTNGAVALLIHVICAFHFQHGWSHAAAWEHTRRRTLELTGWNSGAGLYTNYAMTAMWLIDVRAWWIWLDWPRRQRGWYWAIQIVFAFMMLNATAVFGPGYWGPVVVGFVGAMVWARSAARRG